MREGWEIDEINYWLTKCLISFFRTEHLLSVYEEDKCRERARRVFKPVIGSLDTEETCRRKK